MPEYHEEVSNRARSLWEKAGCPRDRDHEFWFDAEKEFKHFCNAERPSYETRGGKIYRRAGNTNLLEALSFIKDWVTALITLQTAAIGAIGAVVDWKYISTSPLSKFEWPFLTTTVAAFTVSIVFGVLMLNALPGAAQRIPINPVALGSDVFSIANENRYLTLNSYSSFVRYFFLLGVLSFAALIVTRIAISAQ
jgi:Protein of unknown function (DUF2934)